MTKIRQPDSQYHMWRIMVSFMVLLYGISYQPLNIFGEGYVLRCRASFFSLKANQVIFFYINNHKFFFQINNTFFYKHMFLWKKS
jgi:hypothetical protein